MQKAIAYKDALVTVTAGLFGAPQINVKCREFERTLSAEDFAALIYPSIDAAAKAEETTT